MPHRRLALLIALVGAASLAGAAQKAVVIVPVADLWSQSPKGQAVLSDDKRETQVLYGSPVTIQKKEGNWAYISVDSQKKLKQPDIWVGYPGWINIHALNTTYNKEIDGLVISTWIATMQPETLPDVWLPFGSAVFSVGKTNDLFVIPTPLGDRCVPIRNTDHNASPIPRFVSRADILAMAAQFLGTPYLWGGLTPGNGPAQPLVPKETKFGIDCSGLVYICYIMANIYVPRDSYDQWVDAKKISRSELLPADLIFSAKTANPKKVTHVALYAGNNQIIEAPQTGLAVRKISFKEKYGKDLSQVESGETVGERVLYFGRLLKD